MKKIITLCIFVFIAISSSAQFKLLPNGDFTFGNVVRPPYFTTGWYGWGHYFHYKNTAGADTWLKVSLGATNVRIGGNGGYVVFYDTGFQDVYVRNVYTNSDARAKTNISALMNSTQTVLKLKPKTYSLIAPRNADKSSEKEIGFLAQDIEQLIPEAVVTDADGNKLVNYSTFIPILAGSIQELTAKIAALEKEIQQLKAQ